MNIFNKLKNMDSKFSWSFIGVLMGIIAIIFAVYTFTYEASPDLVFKETTNTDVINMREDVSKMTIKYDDKIIDNKINNLKIVTFTVINQGDKDILINDYDPNSPIGFEVKNGNVVDKPSLIAASNSYLEENTKILGKDNKYVFPQLIIEQDEEFTIKMLVLSSNNQVPKIIPYGKIAGLDKIEVISMVEKGEVNFFKKVFSGDIIAQIARLIAYGLSAILLITIILLFIAWFDDFKEACKKNKIIKAYKKTKEYEANKFNDIIFDLYKSHNASMLNDLYELISNKENLQKIGLYDNKHEEYLKQRYEPLDLDFDKLMKYEQLNLQSMREYERLENRDFFPMNYSWKHSAVHKLIESKVISNDKGEYKVATKFVKNLNCFYNYAIAFN